MAGVTSESVGTARRRSVRLDATCAEAVELARAALEETDLDPGGMVGDHLGTVAEAERLVTHLFECLLPGYRGWRYAATVTRVARSKHVTVCETVLLPGPESILAPSWVPWEERVRPGDLGVGDVMPTMPDDDRLVPAYLESDDPAVEETATELGLGRRRVMSRDGRLDCAERWYEGDHGPNADIAEAAPRAARCGTCGFYLPVAGSLRALFGVCGNLYAPDDGRVVSADHGCGAHSEIVADAGPVVDALTTVYDDASVERVTS